MLSAEPFFHTEHQVLSLLRDEGFAPAGVIDIGGSNGAWTSCCREIFPDAHYRIYEPLANQVANYASGLEAVIAAAPGTVLRKIALSDRTGTVDFYHEPHAVGSSLLPMKKATQLRLPSDTLDNDLASHPMPHPAQLLKLDTQGSELTILRHATATLPQVEVAIIEAWFYRGYGAPTPLANEIIEFMAEQKLFLFNLGGAYFNPVGRLYAIDLYFAREALHQRFAQHSTAS